jgi:hypothetical protein
MRTQSNPNLRVLNTEVLDRTGQRSAIKVVVNFLRAKNIQQVRVEIGSVWGRDGKVEDSDQTIPLSDLESFIEQGLNEGTIDWGRRADSHLYPTGTDGYRPGPHVVQRRRFAYDLSRRFPSPGPCTRDQYERNQSLRFRVIPLKDGLRKLISSTRMQREIQPEP